MKRATPRSAGSSLEMYLSEINRYPLLTVEEEQRLARELRGRAATRGRPTGSSPRTCASS